MDRISELPRDILQRIMYFLSQKEAVQTSVLSKSWRYIWCTRPNLDFSDTTFLFVDKILQRYCDQRLRLEELHLSINPDDYWDRGTKWRISGEEWLCLLAKWIPLLTTMGLKKFRLSKHASCRMPPEVFELFEFESLQELHLEGLDQKAIERIGLFKHLQSLCLKVDDIEVEILQKIIASCPLIETLNFEGRIERGSTIQVNDLHNLKHLSFSDYGRTGNKKEGCIEIHPPSLETIYVRRCSIWFHEGADFRNLSDLYLFGIESSLGHLLSCKFPLLKCLTLESCQGLEKEIQLFIDAPNILCFKYVGDGFAPSISFAATLNEWKSDIHLNSGDASPLWFLKLNQLLKSLSQSKISLRIEHFDTIRENTTVQDNDYVVVEYLYLHCRNGLSSFPSVLNVMLGICRPRNIGIFLYKWEIKLVAFQWKILMERGSGSQDQFTQLLFRDLEEVRFEMTKRNRKEWHPATLSELILSGDQSECEESESRFTLKWRENLTASSSSTRQVSGLRYKKEKCKHQSCGKETTIMISETSSNSGRLYYHCSDHGYSHWCDPLELGVGQS